MRFLLFVGEADLLTRITPHIAALALAALIAGCGGGDEANGPTPGDWATDVVVEDPGPVHVHGLGINPADGALFIATHTGLFRAAPDEQTATRVGDLYQDTMGFTVVGPDRFLGSGHPDLRTGQPPFLGLVASTDAGRSWSEVSLGRDADFHVLEASGDLVVGYGSDFETRQPQLLRSEDGGAAWTELRPPAPLIDLAISPEAPDAWLASAENGIWATSNGGGTWDRHGGSPGLLGWSDAGVFLVSGDGAVAASDNAGRTWTAVGNIGGQPAAFEATDDALYAALHSGVIKTSRDRGASWTVRSRPRATVTSG